MTVVSSTLRPGLLVALKTSLVGNVSYHKRVIVPEHTTAEGTEEAQWETTRVIIDRAEHDAGRRAQASARSAVVGACVSTAFGLLCPEADRPALDAAVAEARRIAGEFNATATLSRINVYVIIGRIAPNDAEAVRAVNSEIRSLIKTMEDGITNLDASAIREAANSARKVGAVLSPEAAARVASAVKEARSVARKIVKAGDQAAQEIDRAVIANLEQYRTAFLDLDEVAPVASPEEAPRAIDLTPLEEAIASTRSQVVEAAGAVDNKKKRKKENV